MIEVDVKNVTTQTHTHKLNYKVWIRPTNILGGFIFSIFPPIPTTSLSYGICEHLFFDLAVEGGDPDPDWVGSHIGDPYLLGAVSSLEKKLNRKENA